jgi:hypothetical protein
MADDLMPRLPPGFAADIKLDTASPAYQHTLAAAKEGGLTQGQFSDLLGMEARRAMERAGVAGAPRNDMSFSQKMFAAEVMQKAKRR